LGSYRLHALAHVITEQAERVNSERPAPSSIARDQTDWVPILRDELLP